MKAPTPRQALEALRQIDPCHYIPPVPLGISDAALKAREAFDLDAEMAQANAGQRVIGSPPSANGAAGVRLRAHLASEISDELLREFARETLGARRCSRQYLDTLRIILGNQADAEQKGYVLEMNQRVSFAPQRVVRTIIEQMRAAGITFGSVVGLGEGRSQVVQCFDNSERVPHLGDNVSNAVAVAALERIERAQEAKDDARRDGAVSRGGAINPTRCPASITDADVPY